MSHDDFETEPVPGLPAQLPDDEHIIWQGAPDRAGFARSVLHSRKIMIYFAVIAVWKFGTALYDGGTLVNAVIAASFLLVAALTVYAMIWFYSRAVGNTTIYTITNKRVVMRFGVALPVTFNYPFAQITGANVKQLFDDKGTITLELKEHTKVSWAILWPHARPWKVAEPQPAMRAVADLDAVSQKLSRALHAFHDKPVPTTALHTSKEKTASLGKIGTPSLQEQGA